MDRTLDRSLTTLRRKGLFVLRAAQGRGIAVFNGRVWITEEGDPADHVLGPGDTHVFSITGHVVVEAFEDASVMFFDAEPAAAERRDLAVLRRRAERMRRQAIDEAIDAAWAALKRWFGRAPASSAA